MLKHVKVESGIFIKWEVKVLVKSFLEPAILNKFGSRLLLFRFTKQLFIF